ncbi:MAG: 4-(cytidine 5'-diphospho)-2-C-methyl-D-erythritol kinase [Rhodothermales bacterium]
MEFLTKDAVAKINLGLHVLRRRADGYHDIETIFLPIGWSDRLTFRPADDIRMTCTDASLPTDESNLCMKAARALATEGRGVHIHLEKHIPYGAGLGGGSSDAAATLQGCAAIWGLNTTNLERIAAGLGADVAFFLNGRPSFASGIGEQLERLDSIADPTPREQPKNTHSDTQSAPIKDLKVLVVVPDVHVSTAEAYANVTPNDRDRPDLREAVREPIETWKDTIVNDFEASVTAKYPVIGELRDLLYDSGALYAAMSGSGSAVFGLFAAHPEVAWARIRKEHPTSRTWMGSLRG